MENCPDREEILWLDVHGELEPDDRRAWLAHLAVCPGCRAEHERLVELMRLTREAAAAPELPSRRAQAIENQIMRQINRETERPWWRKLFAPDASRIWKPAYALAAACILVVAFGWFGIEQFRTNHPAQKVAKVEERKEAAEAELIENLELLEEMDVLKKVVKVVDKRNVNL